MTARPLALLVLLVTLAGCAAANQPDPAVLAEEAAYEAEVGNPAYTATDVGDDAFVDAGDPVAPVPTAAPVLDGGAATEGRTGGPATTAPAVVEQDPAPTPEPIYALPPESGLAIGKVTLKTSGLWLWKRCTARVEVKNPTPRVLSGEVLVTFTYDGAAVETRREFVDALAPGADWTFEATSSKRADDAIADVDTNSP